MIIKFPWNILYLDFDRISVSIIVIIDCFTIHAHVIRYRWGCRCHICHIVIMTGVIDTDESLIILYRYFGGLSVTSQMSWVQMRILANQIDAGIVITWPELKSEFGSGQVGAVAGPRLPHADAQFVTGTLSGKNTISCFIYHWNFANYFVYLNMP